MGCKWGRDTGARGLEGLAKHFGERTQAFREVLPSIFIALAKVPRTGGGVSPSTAAGRMFEGSSSFHVE